MKTTNNTLARLIVGCMFACCLFENVQAQITPPGAGGGGGSFTNSSSFVANTNFLISVQDTHIILNWRSQTNKIFLLENRTTLNSGVTWSVLTNYYLSEVNTNWTTFVHTNIVKTQPAVFTGSLT